MSFSLCHLPFNQLIYGDVLPAPLLLLMRQRLPFKIKSSSSFHLISRPSYADVLPAPLLLTMRHRAQSKIGPWQSLRFLSSPSSCDELICANVLDALHCYYGDSVRNVFSRTLILEHKIWEWHWIYELGCFMVEWRGEKRGEHFRRSVQAFDFCFHSRGIMWHHELGVLILNRLTPMHVTAASNTPNHALHVRLPHPIPHLAFPPVPQQLSQHTKLIYTPQLSLL